VTSGPLRLDSRCRRANQIGTSGVMALAGSLRGLVSLERLHLKYERPAAAQRLSTAIHPSIHPYMHLSISHMLVRISHMSEYAGATARLHLKHERPAAAQRNPCVSETECLGPNLVIPMTLQSDCSG
jgi:hypothetical protein